MRRAEQAGAFHGPEDDLNELTARVAQNVGYLLSENGWTKSQLKGYVLAQGQNGVSARTVDNVVAGRGNFELKTLAVVGHILGVDAVLLLLPHEELVAHVGEEGLRPLPSPRPGIINLRSSEDSAAGSSDPMRSSLNSAA